MKIKQYQADDFASRVFEGNMASVSGTQGASVNRCPHCESSIDPMRFLVTTKWLPYRCPSCEKLARPNALHFLVLALLPGIIAIPVGIGASILLSSVNLGFGLACIGYLIAVPLLVRRYGRLSRNI